MTPPILDDPSASAYADEYAPESASGAPEAAWRAEAAKVSGSVTLSHEELRQLIEVCNRASQGDLEARLVGFHTHAELGALVAALNRMLDVSDAFVREASAAMQECSHDRFHRPILLRGLQGAYRQAAVTINAAGAKMRENSEQLSMVETMARDNTGTVTSVAAACEELTSTGMEISRQTGASASVTVDTVREVNRAVESVQLLTAAAGKIVRVVTLINRVAEETNLLALNATIEAAHAGQAGRGFAVVANEIKELSRSTKSATREIQLQVAEMQQTVKSVDGIFQGIHGLIGRIDESFASIQKAMQDQVLANSEISQSVVRLSENTAQVSERIAQSRKHGAGVGDRR